MRAMLLVSLLITLSACGGSPMSVETRTPAPDGQLTLEDRIQIERQQERGHR